MPSQTAPNLLEYLMAFGSIATPLLVLLLSGVGWMVANRYEKARQLEEKLRADRIDVYNAVLKPFIILFAKDEGLQKTKEYKGKTTGDIARETVLSMEYKLAAFKLSLFAPDDVLRAYNNLMQFFYRKESELNIKEMLKYFGIFLLEIRKSVGNETTNLHYYEMLEFQITDIRSYQVNGKYQ